VILPLLVFLRESIEIRNIWRANMYYKGTTFRKSADMGLTSAESQKQEGFLMTSKLYLYKYHENPLNPLCGKVTLMFFIIQALCVYYNLYGYETTSL
jgi:hypothetical protein